MPLNLTSPDFGTGPYAAERDPQVGMAWITKDGERTGKSYVEMKTAARVCRQLNAEHQLAHVPEVGPTVFDGFLEEEPAAPAPKPRKEPKAKAPAVPTPAPKAPAADRPASKFATREEWLGAFVAAARPIFAERGHPLPEKIRVSVGFMFRGAKAIGQCWHESASADGTREIFVIPTLDDSSRIADVLTHELAHTLFGPDEKHGKNFKAVVRALGLDGKATATVAGEGWHEWADPILEELGAIPHAAIDPKGHSRDKKKTYLLKATCAKCEFTFRATAKHLNGKSLICPDEDCGGSVEVEGSEDIGGDEE
ncbi:MAG TPA: hypothetical protein VKQ30_16220 [Ktedonobacterales bacterium]|nr:hypothetical protein [Ktedonobacterales bacterium]